MKSKESEYKQLFLIEAKDNLELLDNLFIRLEKDHSDESAVGEIFRIMHTFKGNAMGMGFEAIGELSHIIEDVMMAIKEKKIKLNQDLFKLIFRANDKLGSLVSALETDEKVSYLGIKTSLSIFLKKELEKGAPVDNNEEQAPSDQSEQKKSEKEVDISFSDFIQIPVKKMDDLMNEVGQLIIERDRLITVMSQTKLSTAELEPLKRISSGLQYSIMNVRMVQVGFLFNKFHRVLRDAATVEEKEVNLELKGTDVEIDRNILKVISDSLVHLIRNSVSHGIESPDIRTELGKTEQGTISLGAKYERDRVVISVSDNGAGIDTESIRKKIVERKLVPESTAEKLSSDEVIQYIFEAGFSSAKKVNELSGRGVGMDAVKKSVESIGGQVKIQTKFGQGTTIELHVPASLALKGTLLFEVENQEYAVALSYTEAVIKIQKKEIHKLGSGLTIDFEEKPINIIFLKDVLKMKSLTDANQKGAFHTSFDALEESQECEIIIVSYGSKSIGIVVDVVIQQKEVIEKPLKKPLENIKLISGVTILGNGKVCPIIDISVLTSLIHKQSNQWE
ncbi:MAG: chemotaxis protein CheA [Cyclobacteriaceae bacterium]